MSDQPTDIIADVFTQAIDGEIPRKVLTGGSNAQRQRLDRLTSPEGPKPVDFDGAVGLLNNLPAALLSMAVRRLFPGAFKTQEPGNGQVSGLMLGSAVVLARVSELVTTMTEAVKDGRVTTEEQTAILQKIEEARLQLDQLEAVTKSVSTPKPARVR